MGQKFKRSWVLIKTSAGILKQEKKMLVFPLISMISVLFLVTIFTLPMYLSGSFNANFSIYKPTIFPFFLLFYLIFYTIVIFSNSALIGLVVARLNGKNASIADGFKIAMNHIVDILGYSLIASTVGLILSIIQDKLGAVGKLVTFISDIAWNVITFLVVPVLVIEGIGPVKAIKRSSHLLKKTWGEQIIGNVGIGYFFGIIIFVLIFTLFPFGMYTFSHHMIGLSLSIGLILVLSVMSVIIISTTLDTIYRVILYRYAIDGSVSENFDSGILKDSFKRK